MLTVYLSSSRRIVYFIYFTKEEKGKGKLYFLFIIRTKGKIIPYSLDKYPNIW